MLKIAIVIGSTRPGRKGEVVGHWVHTLASERGDAEYTLVDIAQQNLPLLDEPVPPSMHRYSQPHTLAWARLVAGFDGFVFVTPEYNHGTSGALKNALDFLYVEWNNKACGFVGYGSAGGTRAVEHLRGIVAELQMASVRNQVQLSLFTDWQEMKTFKPTERAAKAVTPMLDQLLAWAGALKTLRAPA